MKVYAVGGYNEVGKNMTVVESGEDAVILDMGLHLESYIRYTDDDEIEHISAKALREVGAIPDDTCVQHLKEKIKAIIPTHAHLDHVGAIVYMANSYKAPVICTPYTAEVIKAIKEDERINLKCPIKTLNVNSTLRLTQNITIEFINVTHSTPQVVMVAVHTKEGTLIYANDFKFDNHPLIGRRPNYERLKELGKEGVKCLIVDSTRADKPLKTPSEAVAKELLRDVMLGTDSKGHGVIVTTFSSHLARLKSIIEFAKKLDRKIVFLGRSLSKYVEAAEKADIVEFSTQVELVKYKKQVKKTLTRIQKEGREKYLLVVTGHQAEPKSTLSRMVTGELAYHFQPNDHVIFSCTIIPHQVNIDNREKLEHSLKEKGVRIFRDIHVSGHAAKEDLRDLLGMIKPLHIIPAHGDTHMKTALLNLAIEMGYDNHKSVHLLDDGENFLLR